jgi:dTDP-4-dehydrorhamnose 3,5-epimerase
MERVEAVRPATITLKKIPTSLPSVFILEPRVFRDERGFFFESYNQRVLADLGIVEEFVQDNHSCSGRNVLRGLHYQVKHAQGKLVRAAEGEILDVAVDMRRSSPTFGRWEAVRLSGENHRMLWIPAGFAHGFRVLSEKAHVLYKATDFYAPEHERTLAWNDPQLKINWELDGEPVTAVPVVSAKDQQSARFCDAECFD